MPYNTATEGARRAREKGVQHDRVMSKGHKIFCLDATSIVNSPPSGRGILRKTVARQCQRSGKLQYSGQIGDQITAWHAS